MFEMSKFKKNTEEGKIQKLVKTHIGGTFCVVIFVKRESRKCCKQSHYGIGWMYKKPIKEASYIYFKFLANYYYYCQIKFWN